MAYSSDKPAEKAQRGFVPPQSDEEQFLMRRAQDLFHTADARGVPRHSGFLTGREQDLCRVAMNKCGCRSYEFNGGWPGAERRVLCITPEDCLWSEEPVACVRLMLSLPAGTAAPEHRDYLGALMGLEIDRSCLGDILPDPRTPGLAYLFCLEDKAEFICRELTGVGKFPVRAEVCNAALAAQIPQPERMRKTGTVPSLRLDAVLSEVMGTGRSQAAEYIAAGRVEVNHLPEQRQHAPVYEGDIFTVRGRGRWQLETIKGKSKKDRVIIEYFQY